LNSEDKALCASKLLKIARRGLKMKLSVTLLGEEGQIVSPPLAFFNDHVGGYHLNRGEVIKVTATYDNPTGNLLPKEAMGIDAGFWVPGDELDLLYAG